MEKSINIQIVEAKAKLVEVLNSLQLPIVITQMIMQEVLGLVNIEVEKALEQEKQSA